MARDGDAARFDGRSRFGLATPLTRQCEGTTVQGNQCRRRAAPGERFCSLHGDEAQTLREFQKEAVLDALPRVFAFHLAAEAAGITHVTLKDWRNDDTEFAQACIDARDAALDTIEGALVQRARGMEHTERTKELIDGQLVVTKETTRLHVSDKAAELILRGERPQYRHQWEPPPSTVTDPVESKAREIFENPEAAKLIDEALAIADSA